MTMSRSSVASRASATRRRAGHARGDRARVHAARSRSDAREPRVAGPPPRRARVCAPRCLDSKSSCAKEGATCAVEGATYGTLCFKTPGGVGASGVSFERVCPQGTPEADTSCESVPLGPDPYQVQGLYCSCQKPSGSACVCGCRRPEPNQPVSWDVSSVTTRCVRRLAPVSLARSGREKRLGLRAPGHRDRTKRRIAIRQNAGCRSHKTAHRDQTKRRMPITQNGASRSAEQ
jgi:hypothetical protein